MAKLEAFKEFVKTKPELINFIKDKKNTWQEFYEIYDIYGEDPNVWNNYQDDRAIPLAELTGFIKGINMSNVQKYITNAQKAINVIQELTTKTPTIPKVVPKTPRPINKFFGD